MMKFLWILQYILAVGASRSTSNPPPQAPTFNPDGQKKVDRRIFKQYEESVGIGYNKYIPKKDASIVRVSTWNVHMLQDLLDEERSAVKEFLEDVKRIDADVIMMQEIPKEHSDRFDEFSVGLETIGYKHQAVKFGEDAALGVMIASRFEILKSSHFELGSKRVLLDAELDIHGTRWTLLGTHLEVGSAAVRRKQVELITEHVRKMDGNVMVMGDFNSVWGSDELEQLRSDRVVKEVFRRQLEWPHPNYTCWAGKEIDFMFSSQHPVGAYIFHSTTSDHLAILADFIVSPEARNNEAFQYVFMGVFALITVIALYVAMFICVPEQYWAGQPYQMITE